jgi:hypothetical protein
MMKFQRQGCVLSNDYEELSIREVKPLDIPVFILVALSAKAESHHVTCDGSVCQGRAGPRDRRRYFSEEGE